MQAKFYSGLIIFYILSFLITAGSLNAENNFSPVRKIPYFHKKYKDENSSRGDLFAPYGTIDEHNFVIQCNKMIGPLRTELCLDLSSKFEFDDDFYLKADKLSINLGLHSIFSISKKELLLYLSGQGKEVGNLSQKAADFWNKSGNRKLNYFLNIPSWSAIKVNNRGISPSKWNDRILKIIGDARIDESRLKGIELVLARFFYQEKFTGNSTVEAFYLPDTSVVSIEKEFVVYSQLAKRLKTLFSKTQISGPGFNGFSPDFKESSQVWLSRVEISDRDTYFNGLSWQEDIIWPSEHEENIRFFDRLFQEKGFKLPYWLRVRHLDISQGLSGFELGIFLCGITCRQFSYGIKKSFFPLSPFSSFQQKEAIKKLFWRLHRLASHRNFLLKTRVGNDQSRTCFAIIDSRKNKIIVVISDLKSRSKKFTLQLKKLPLRRGEKAELKHEVFSQNFGVFQKFASLIVTGPYIQHSFLNRAPIIHWLTWEKKR
ncbi:hypothetical protein ACFL35_21140 [Candidatus Riflebacteria bacterium]